MRSTLPAVPLLTIGDTGEMITVAARMNAIHVLRPSGAADRERVIGGPGFATG